MNWKQTLNRARAKGYSMLTTIDGTIGDRLRRANQVAGSPLLSLEEIAEREAFASGKNSSSSTNSGSVNKREPAPVIVYHMDKQKRDVVPITDLLTEQNISFRVLNLEGDPAAQAAVRRDSKGFRLPVVFIAGEVLGGRVELINSIASRQLSKLVFGE